MESTFVLPVVEALIV